MMSKLKIVVLALNIITSLLIQRPFGTVIYDIAAKYDGIIAVADLRRVEKLAVKVKKAELDITFLKNCLSLNVIPKFLLFHLPHTNHVDTNAIRKRLLRSAIKRRYG